MRRRMKTSKAVLAFVINCEVGKIYQMMNLNGPNTIEQKKFQPDVAPIFRVVFFLLSGLLFFLDSFSFAEKKRKAENKNFQCDIR